MLVEELRLLCIAIGLNCVASEFYKDGKYVLEGEGGLQLSAQDFTNMLSTWCDKYPIISIEDAMAEGDWDGWASVCSWSATACSSPTPRS
jgi:enolase